jgi:signal transduction histidine kinase/CHASE3 domain sensor protein
MRRHLTARIAAAVAVVGITFVAAIIVLAISISDLRDSARGANRVERTLQTATRVGALVVDAETAVRGFALTNDDSFLTPWRTAQFNLPPATKQLTDVRYGDANSRVLAQSIANDARAYISDYSIPLVGTLRRSPTAGRDIITTGSGKGRVDAIRLEISRFSAALRTVADERSALAAVHARQAMRIAVIAAIVSALLFVGLILYLARSVAGPIRRAAAAAAQVGRGDYSTRLTESRSDEIGQLSHAFNAMSTALQTSTAELESQHAELENQNVELERQAVELENQAVELEAQASELEAGQHELTDANRTLTERSAQLEVSAAALRTAHERVGLYADVAEALGQRPALRDRAETILRSIADMTDSAVGVVYTTARHDIDSFLPVGARGIDPAVLPQSLSAMDGLAGRALAERRPIRGAHDAGDLRISSFGSEVPIRRELHVPMMHGDVVTGVLSLGRTDDRPFDHEEIEAIEHLAEQGAVALKNALETQRSRWLADLMRAVLDATGDAIHLMGPNRSVILSNPAMSEFVSDVLLNGADVSLGSDEITTFVAERTADPDEYRRRVAEIHADPDLERVDEFELVDVNRWVRRYTAPVRTDSGELIGRIFVLTETTERRQAERAKDELMATVSHELRTPLAAILGFTELLMARDYDLEERLEYLGTVHQQAERLSDLISDFLDLQRLEHSDEGVVLKPVDILDILQGQISLFSKQSDRHELRLEVGAAKEELRIKGDADRLRRALANLLSNAIKYSPDGGDVTIEATRSNGSVTVAVSDHGLGIPSDSQSRIFDRFFRVDSSETRSIGGTGLGLALVREIMHAHNGEVGFDSVEGQGSRFWFKVPAA